MAYDEIAAAIQGIRSRLDTLASINTDNIRVPGGPQERYHQIVEEAYAALGLVETQVDELRAELEYQHKRLDEIRDGAPKPETGQAEQNSAGWNEIPPDQPYFSSYLLPGRPSASKEKKA